MTFEQQLFETLNCTCAATRQSFAQYVGMRQPRMQLLTTIAEKGEISHAALGRALSIDGATITRLVKQFEAEGILSRRLDPDDNRYTLVSLTDSGRQMAAALGAAHAEYQTRLLEGISREDQETLLRVLEQLRANTRAVQGDSPTSDE